MKMRLCDLCCIAVFMVTLAACARADGRSPASARHGRLSRKYKGHVHLKNSPIEVVYSTNRHHQHRGLKPSSLNIDAPSKKYKRHHRDTHPKYARNVPKRKIPHKRPFKRRPQKPSVHQVAYKAAPSRLHHYEAAASQHHRDYYKPVRHTVRHDSYGNPIRTGYKTGDFDPHPNQLTDDKEMYDEFTPHEGYSSDDIEIVNAFSKDSPTFAEPPLHYGDTDYHFEDSDRDTEVRNHNLMVKLFKKKKNTPKKSYNKHRTYLKSMNHVVGGQYAEPPARIIPDDEDDFRYSDTVQSASVSSYINYKNSNLAFSPQNLNDVFSISD